MKQALKDDTDNSAKLEALSQNLVNDPDPMRLQEARQIISTLAETLSDSERSDILGVIDRGSDQSKANYISKLVEDKTAGVDASIAERQPE